MSDLCVSRCCRLASSSLLLGLGVALLTSPSYGQIDQGSQFQSKEESGPQSKAESQPATVPVSGVPDIVVTIDDDQLTLLDDIVFVVKVTNSKKDQQLCVNEIRVLGPPRIPNSRFRVVRDRERKTLGCAYGATAWTETFIFRAPHRLWDELRPFMWGSSRADKIRTDVTYAGYTLDNKPVGLFGRSSTVTPIRYVTRYWVLIVGIGLGAFLLLLFRVFVLRQTFTLGTAAGSWLSATLIGCLALLLSTASTAFNLPITVDVKDLTGAVILGLISTTLTGPLTKAIGSNRQGHKTGTPGNAAVK